MADFGLYVRVSVDFWDDPDFAVLSSDARDFYLRLIAYSRKHLTDGVVPVAVASSWRRRAAYRTVVSTLAAQGAIVLSRDAVTVSAFLNWNPSKQEVTQEREKAKERMRRSRNDDRNVRPNKRRTNGNVRCTESETESEKEILKNSHATRANSYARAREASPEGGRQPKKIRPHDWLRLIVSRAYREHAAQAWSGATDAQMATLANWAQEQASTLETREECVSRALAGFFGDSWCRDNGFPFAAFLKAPEKFLKSPSAIEPTVVETEIEKLSRQGREHLRRGTPESIAAYEQINERIHRIKNQSHLRSA